MSVLVNILLCALAAVASLVLRRQVGQHILRIGKIVLLDLSLNDVHYSGTLYDQTYHFTFTSARLVLRFHWPTKFCPRWLTFRTKDVLYRSSTADISAGDLSVTLWFFPFLFGQTAGPWINVGIDDFRIRVFGSHATPKYIKLLRQNLVGTVLGGKILKLDDFGTSVRCSGFTESAVESEVDPDADGKNEHREKVPSTVPQDGPYHEKLGDPDGAADESIAGENGGFKDSSRKVPEKRSAEAVPYINREQDEVRISAYARGLMMDNTEGRVYTFGSVDAQLRRNWVANRGNFVMIAKESRWVRVPFSHEMQPHKSFWT